MARVVEELISSLGAGVVATGAAVDRRYGCDWSGMTPQQPLALVRPRSTAQVATALKICHAYGQPVVPQGGLTGLAGGATPNAGNIALSLERMRGIEELDRAAAAITVLAGTPLEVVQQAAGTAGFCLGIDLGARGSCQIGGNIATNAGGSKVIRYGMTREQVLGLEAVLADGTVVSALNKMLKNNAGYDVKQLFIGTEGTLGVITRAVLRLHPQAKTCCTALCACATYDAVVALLRRAQEALGSLSAFEIMWQDYYRFVTGDGATKGRPLPDTYPYYALVEFTGSDPEGDAARFEAMLGEALGSGGVLDALIAQSEKEAQAFWAVRESEIIDTLPNLLNFDVGLPIGRIDEFVRECRTRLQAQWPGSHNLFFGHIGDSNLHLAFSMTDAAGTGMHDVEAVVYGTVRTMGGSISAEHGIGTHKRAYLGHSRSGSELNLMRVVKCALDPKGILNPGKVL